MKHLAVASILCLLTAIPSGADDWPGWRGPSGMGQSPGRDLPTVWGGKDQKNVLWKSPLFETPEKIRRDQNQSSPIVVGDRVFVTVSFWPAGTTEKELPEHHVLAFAASDGTKLWDVKIAPGPWLLKDLRGGYTVPTPVSDGKSVVVAFGSSVLAALDVDGQLRWRREIVPHFYDVAVGASPILYKDLVLLLSDQVRDKKASSLLAYELATGEIRYKVDRPDADWTHSTPVLTVIAGKTQLLVAASSGPQGLDPDTGKKLWWYKSNERLGDTCTPVFAGGVVYVDSGRGGTGVAVDPTGTDDVTATHLKWKAPKVPEGFSSAVASGKLLYRAVSPGVVSCRDLDDGTEIFKERLEGLDPAVSPIATADGRIYFASSGKSHVLRADRKLDAVSANDLGDPNRASAAIAGGRIYLKGGRYLFCVGAK